ncbi:transposase [Trichothermofontia sichuanensis B231]|uniref:helix-turn-helix domain-containing protein n=1 Tax=Trichothermofontia sichuanensis TaxID=3045816 RepID=UPI002245300D|nr:transposase [Trichothermofontia sichuanensis]UZQ53411.1 transposase [Trichothermofontia sichuanensis B231]
MKAYPLAFRQKILAVYESEPISQRQLAQRFRVAKSFVQKLLKQQRETGSIAPKVRTQQTPTKLNSEQLAILARLVADNNDATLEELRQLLADATGVTVSKSTIDRMLKKLNITFKKKHSMRRSKPVNRSRKNG